VENDAEQHHLEPGQRGTDPRDVGMIILEIEIHQEVTAIIPVRGWALEAWG
jgi:hypothetical protein